MRKGEENVRKSWETITTPPENDLIAEARASMDSISKWFVGSSRRMTEGYSMAERKRKENEREKLAR